MNCISPCHASHLGILCLASFNFRFLAPQTRQVVHSTWVWAGHGKPLQPSTCVINVAGSAAFHHLQLVPWPGQFIVRGAYVPLSFISSCWTRSACKGN